MDVPTLPPADVSESLPAGVRIPLQVVAGEVGVVAESDVLTLTGQLVLPPVGAVITANLPQGHRTSVSVSPRPGGVVVAGRF